MRRTSITDHAGVLMGSTGPRSGGYSGYVAWKKPRPNTWKIKEGAARFGAKGPQTSKSIEFF
jgi:hypothetical protein